jgi:hypothetical protein
VICVGGFPIAVRPLWQLAQLLVTPLWAVRAFPGLLLKVLGPIGAAAVDAGATAKGAAIIDARGAAGAVATGAAIIGDRNEAPGAVATGAFPGVSAETDDGARAVIGAAAVAVGPLAGAGVFAGARACTTSLEFDSGAAVAVGPIFAGPDVDAGAMRAALVEKLKAVGADGAGVTVTGAAAGANVEVVPTDAVTGIFAKVDVGPSVEFDSALVVVGFAALVVAVDVVGFVDVAGAVEFAALVVVVDAAVAGAVVVVVFAAVVVVVVVAATACVAHVPDDFRPSQLDVLV